MFRFALYICFIIQPRHTMATKNPDFYHVTVAVPRTVQAALHSERASRTLSNPGASIPTVADIASEWLTSKALEPKVAGILACQEA
jgi:hypothetical protein